MTEKLKIKLSIIVGLCLVLLVACKKKTEPVPVENPTPKSGYVGFLNTTKFETLQGVAPTPAGGSTQAYFSSEFITSSVNPGTYADAGNNTFQSSSSSGNDENQLGPKCRYLPSQVIFFAIFNANGLL